NKQQNIFAKPTYKTTHKANPANPKSERETLGFASEHLPPSFEPTSRDTSSEQTHPSSNQPGNARTRRYFNDAGLHARGSATVKSRAPEVSSEGVAFQLSEFQRFRISA